MTFATVQAFAPSANERITMRLPKRERDKLKRLKKVKPRIPVAPPSRRHKSKRDYKRVKKIDISDQ